MKGNVAIELDTLKDSVDNLFETRPQPIRVSFKNLRYSVNSIPGDPHSPKKPVLQGVSGEVKPGELVAIMGPSGSSKTTLINALAGRLPQGQLEGDILYNDHPVTKASKRVTSYVLQDDVFHSSLSVYETLYFTAMLKLPQYLSVAEKEDRVKRAIKALGLQGCMHSRVGNMFMRGISGGERKRLNIGNEILNNPSVMLLDEPTSGLDSTTALLIIELMKFFAQHGRTVICSIHQPSSQIFNSFDNVILLSKGRMLYYGPPAQVVSYFSDLGYQCHPHWNPADYFMDLASMNEEVTKELAVKFKPLRDAEKAYFQIESGKSVDSPVREVTDSSRKWETSWWWQFYYLSMRSFTLRKNSSWTNIDLYQTIAISLIVGVLWFQLSLSESTLKERIGLIFFMSIFLSFRPMFDAMTLFPAERPVLMKERATGSYRLSAYYLAKSLSEAPVTLFFPCVFIIITYWMTGLNPLFSHFIAFLFSMALSVLSAEAFGLLFSAAFMDVKKATTSASVLFLGFMLLGGFYIKSSNIPIWIRWVQYISPVKYSYGLLLHIEFIGRHFSCASADSAFSFCPTHRISGQEALDEYDLSINPGLCAGVLLGYLIVLRYFAYLCLRKTSR